MIAIDVSPISYLNVPAEIQDLKRKLNEDFTRNAKINGLASILYYPGQHCLPMGHAELEVEGTCYSTTSFQGPLSEKIKAAKDGRLPFKQCHISVTPQQLARFRNRENIFSLTCMHQVSRTLSKHLDFHVPQLINFSPMASYGYLNFSKAMGNKRITKFESHGNVNSINFLEVSLGVLGESFFIMILMDKLADKILGN